MQIRLTKNKRSQVKMNQNEFKDLLARLEAGQLSIKESEDLVDWLGKDTSDPERTEWIVQYLQQSNQRQPDTILLAKMKEKLPSIFKQEKAGSNVAFIRSHFLKYGAVFLLLIGGAVLYFSQPTKHSQISVVEKPTISEKIEILPGTDGALLTLADGQTILLDSVENGVVASQKGAQIVSENGELVYKKSELRSSGINYNTIRGQIPHSRKIISNQIVIRFCKYNNFS